MTNPQAQLARELRWRPWPPGDPAPEIWQIIFELDRKIQVQVIDAVLEAQIGSARAHIAGLEKVRKIVGAVRG